MGPSFYGSGNVESTEQKGPIVPSVMNASPEMETSTLPTGNQITESVQITHTLRKWRNMLINKIDLVRAEWETQKSAARNELASADEYLQKNVFTDTHENQELLVPSTILSLGAFFSGRVLSNPLNWGSKKNILAGRPSLLGKVCTSIPARLLLPIALASTVFYQLTPVTAVNVVDTIQKDVLPKPVVDDCRRLWNEYYVHGLAKATRSLSTNCNDQLQKGVRFVRESINNALN
ncbi:hypothetical protein HG536_0D03410 [Torulaspora globosa]|uniref:MICOS complex subunit n=1 Tax=Torulaspora globosa TaxID=48254 RepID=A0A7G3ZH33_9SACH|nr:uncharacterized protein HG536_0D03410 [Torulaspora globosa]QLL32819.1 hypothetical protein HG536_0D03410 [Torulaspora globosa]